MRPRAAALLLPTLLSASGLLAEPAARPPASIRLGRDVVPTFEALRLDLDPRRPDYRGAVHVELTVARPTRAFSFHAEELELGTVLLKRGTTEIPLRHAKGEHATERVELDAPLQPGAYTLDVEFTNDFGTRATGLYRVETGGESYAFTQLEADDAREAFPCWDEPSFKIPYQVTLRIPEGHLAVSNTPVESESVADGARTVTFRRTRPLPSYLLAIASGPLEAVPIPGMSVPGRVITVKGASPLAAEAVRAVPPLLAALERYFGRPYPYEKLDLIAVPEFWPGAMENAGAITFADGILLVDPRSASMEQRRLLASVAAHEMAHMWFGDLVTMEWWDDLWLNESFASWMGDKVTDEVFPEMGVEVAAVEAAQRAMITDARLSTRAIRQPVLTLDNLLQSADELAYDKGQAVLGMVEAWIGPAVFQKAIAAYMREHAYGNAVAADLWRALGRASGRDVGSVLATFLDQPGLPLVAVESLEGGRVTLAQQRFLNAGTTAPPATWQVPVGLLPQGAAKARTVLLATPKASYPTVAGPHAAWVHPNAGERGYYRWSVPPAMLAALTADAPRTLSVRERVAFVGNAEALLDAGLLKGDALLRLLTAFAQDPAPEVVEAVVATMGRVRKPFAAPGLEDAWAAWVRRTLGPALARIGSARKDGESDAVAALRGTLLLLLGRDGRDPAALAEGARLARLYLEAPASIDPALASVAVKLAAMGGDRALFDAYRKRFETTTVPAERERYLSGLGSFRDPGLLDEALRYAVSGPLRPQEILTISRAMSGELALQDRPFAWLSSNYDAVATRIPPMYAVYLPNYGAGCTKEREQEAEAFFGDPEHAPAGTQKSLAKVQEATRDCAALRAREGAAVAAYLTSAAP